MRVGGRAAARRRRHGQEPGARGAHTASFDLAGNTRELRAVNHRKPGGRCLLSETMAIAVAVARDLSRHSCRRIAGSLTEASGGGGARAR